MKVYILCSALFLIACHSQASEYEHFQKADYLFNQGKFEEAIKEYELAIDENPELVAVYNRLGYIYQYELNDTQKAIEIYLKGLQKENSNYSLNLNIMHAFFEQENIPKGIKHYKILSDIRSEKDRYSFPRETINMITKDLGQDEVIGFCKEYLSINPTDKMLREVLSRIYMGKKDYKNARTELEAMLRYGYEAGFVYFDLGVCSYYLGQYDNALTLLSTAKQLGEYVPEEYFEMVKQRIEKKP
jgi:tetratricopeptide (TPR) repeat protein